jgi:hypothetical protein
MKPTDISPEHPLRRLFRNALEFGCKVNPPRDETIADYIEEHILCGFICTENLYRIRDISGKRLDDIADMLEEGNILLNAESFDREFEVHKHIGDFTLFMLSMFPASFRERTGKEFILGRIVVPGSDLAELYMIQGRRSYRIASEFENRELFQELSVNFEMYRDLLELVRIYIESFDDGGNRILKEISGNA